MADIGRLNTIIRAWEEGRPAFASFAHADPQTAIEFSSAPYDGIIFEMEHNPFDGHGLQDALQYLLNRKQIFTAGSLAPAVTPIVRVPVNGVERNQSFAKQALDRGVYGVVWPHIGDAEQAYNAVASCRYARPKGADRCEPAGVRGDGPSSACRYWGLTQQEYYARADVWPLNPQGEILVAIMCEEVRAIKNLPKILEEVPGIGVVIIGEGDLSQDLGVPRQYDHPSVVSAMDEILGICKQYNVACGHPHVDSKNVEALLQKGFRYLMPAPVYTFPALELGRKAAGRA